MGQTPCCIVPLWTRDPCLPCHPASPHTFAFQLRGVPRLRRRRTGEDPPTEHQSDGCAPCAACTLLREGVLMLLGGTRRLGALRDEDEQRIITGVLPSFAYHLASLHLTLTRGRLIVFGRSSSPSPHSCHTQRPVLSLGPPLERTSCVAPAALPSRGRRACVSGRLVTRDPRHRLQPSEWTGGDSGRDALTRRRCVQRRARPRVAAHWTP